jgi:hypothetical protein
MAAMKFRYAYFSVWVVVVFLILAVQSPAQAEVIRQFDADVRLNLDCSLDVTETIKIDFEDSSRHGIFRIIPVEYARHGGNYSLPFKLLSVTDQGDRPIDYVESRSGSNVNIRIGDRNILHTGLNTYRIHYLVRRAINFFTNEPELYWNATGNDWPFRIEKASAWFHPPKGVRISDIQTACYVGPMGSTVSGAVNKTNEYIEYQGKNLIAGQGLTLVARLPAGCVVPPPQWQEFAWFLADWWPIILLPVAMCMYVVPVILQRGHNPSGNQAIAVEWNPPKDLSPAEVGTLIDESCDMQDVVSTLIDLAARGYLKIKEVQSSNFLFFSNKDYEFIRENAFSNGDVLLPHEDAFLSALFQDGKTETTLSDLREKFYTHLPYIRSAVYESLTRKGLFVEDPEIVRTRYTQSSFGIYFVGFVSFVLPFPNHWAFAGGLFLAATILGLTARFMPSRTQAGWNKRAECLGFQRFVRTAEKNRIAVLAKDDPTIFGRLLPFAMVLGAADQWAYAFHDLLSQPPTWYVPYNYGSSDYHFSSSNFVHDLGHGVNTMGQTFASVPPSSASSGGSGLSGGFSGGGFGGGGGGSW